MGINRVAGNYEDLAVLSLLRCGMHGQWVRGESVGGAPLGSMARELNSCSQLWKASWWKAEALG